MDHFTELLMSSSYARYSMLQQEEISRKIDKRICESNNSIEELIRRTLKR